MSETRPEPSAPPLPTADVHSVLTTVVRHQERLQDQLNQLSTLCNNLSDHLNRSVNSTNQAHNRLTGFHNKFDAHLQPFNDLHAVHTPHGPIPPPLASSPGFVSAQGPQPVNPDMAELEDCLNVLRTPTHSLRDAFFHTSS